MAVHLLLENKTNRKMEYDGSPPTTCGDDGGEEEECPMITVGHDGGREMGRSYSGNRDAGNTLRGNTREV
jgi:hypothetical protein